MTASRVAPGVEEAYHDCEQTTRREAANFFYGIRLLPPRKRQAMSAVYALARRIDDIGDGTLPAAEKQALLAREREAVGLLRAGEPGEDPVYVALADAGPRFGLPLDAFEALIDGVDQDLRGDRFETFADTHLYCQRVAGSIGRLCVAIFGAGQPQAFVYADELGVAMQLTNILRDVREDRANGRVYLPREDLVRFGGEELLASPAASLEQLVRFEAQRNQEWFGRGLRLLPLLDRRSTSCVLAMTGIYRRILQRIEEEPLAITRGRISLPIWEKATLALRSIATAGAGAGAPS